MKAPNSRVRKWFRVLKWTVLILLFIVVLAVTATVSLKPWVNEREVITPLEGGVRIDEQGVLGNFYSSVGDSRGSVLVIGGSEGGVSITTDNMAKSLSEAGFDALALSYWGAPNQHAEMIEIPLETFDAGLDYLRSQSSAEQPLAVVGYSKGAEAALLMAARRNSISAIVAGVPTHVSWQAPEPIGSLVGGTSTFSDGGRPLPYLPYSNVNFFAGPGPFEIHQKSLIEEHLHPDAQIEIENARARILLLCGEKDDVWPSCVMARKLQERARRAGGQVPRLIDFPTAGHLVLGSPQSDFLREDLEKIPKLPTLAADIEAREVAWPIVIEFLSNALGESSDLEESAGDAP